MSLISGGSEQVSWDMDNKNPDISAPGHVLNEVETVES